MQRPFRSVGICSRLSYKTGRTRRSRGANLEEAWQNTDVRSLSKTCKVSFTSVQMGAVEELDLGEWACKMEIKRM
jgi:hypothetical protein